jgi:hypothetical protein
MTDSRAAHDPDRLPWLADDRKPRRKRDANPLLFWAFLAALLVAGVSYWLGMRSIGDPDALPDLAASSPPAATIQLPQAANDQAPPSQVQAPGLPEVRPATGSEVKIPGVDRALPAKPKPARQADAKPKALPSAAKVSPRAVRARVALASTDQRPGEFEAITA